MSRRSYKSVSGGGILPAGYAELEYLEATGTQYIDLNYIPKTNTWIDTYISASVDSQYPRPGSEVGNIFGVYENDIDNCFHVNFGGDSNTGPYTLNFWVKPYRPGIYSGKSIGQQNSYMNKLNVRFGNNICKYGDIQYELPDKPIDSTMTLILFGCNNKGIKKPQNRHSYLRVYDFFNINEGETMVRRFIPAIRLSDNKPGMYDLCGSICPLTGTPFYINAASGEFLYQLKN